MNFGYLLFVSENKDIDYLKLAYALAVNIKNTQKPGYNQVALVINNKNQIKELNSPWVFDYVIEWSEKSGWDCRAWMDQLTPFDYTVCLDVDMLFFRDTSHWIDYFIENTDLYITNKSYTHRQETVQSDFYRKTFTVNELPNLYSFYTFFKKDSSLTKEFFQLSRYITEYPNEFKNLYLTKQKPDIMGTDEVFSLAAKLLDIQDIISYEMEFPKVVHLKPMVQNWSWSAEKVTDLVGFYLNEDGNLKIGNYQQFDIVHYVEKKLLTDEYLNIFEERLWKK